MDKPITGEEIARLLSGLHNHLDSFIKSKYENEKVTTINRETIIYTEEDVLKLLKALGHPEPKWGISLTLEEFHKRRNETLTKK